MGGRSNASATRAGVGALTGPVGECQICSRKRRGASRSPGVLEYEAITDSWIEPRGDPQPERERVEQACKEREIRSGEGSEIAKFYSKSGYCARPGA